MTTVKLETRSIKDVNASWVRQDFGPMDKLRADIQANGIKHPLLIAPDFLMYDGARRFQVALQLNMDTVPVQICRSWSAVVEAMKEVPQEDTYPMTWLEVDDLWERVFKPIQDAQRRTAAVVNRRRNKARGISYREQPAYSAFVHDLAAIYNVSPAQVKLLRDGVHRLQKVEGERANFVNAIRAAISSAEPHARHIVQARVLKTLTERLEVGTLTETEAISLFTEQIHSAPLHKPLQFTRRKIPAPGLMLEPYAPKVPLSAIQNLADVLAQVAQQSSDIRNFHVTARHKETYTAICESIAASMRKIYKLRRRLEHANEAPPSTENKS